MASRDRSGAILGLLGVAGNVLGVVLLRDVPGAYRPGSLDAWAAGSLAHPAAAAWSAVAFTLGLVALAGWALSLGRDFGPGPARAAVWSMVAGSLLNAAGTLAPAVLVLHVAPGASAEAIRPTARALLGLTLSLDGLFNLLFGMGLAVAAAAVARAERPAGGGLGWLGCLGVAAGLATAPVALQIVSDGAAAWLAVAGPLWLAYVLARSVAWAR
jgi:hypothetical protein